MRINYLLAFQTLQLDTLQIAITAILLFALGYWIGTWKSKKLIRRIIKMEKKIMDLNSELLYGTPTTP